ncbi:MAG: hypothetical protein LPJ89_04785 [Hymenobacteraceae bacterium]|nr:hypothetical protein [Hymenobacteraceae bacterium]MDX5395121.1 hypothetical protein [Hymenobacteraceae bacterium]MDX5443082.1 hypothetical protein [Hymenobacteraceae bacterium]MDX5511159.1 hypothetical protein [Hymenobacteraceae bacterium]
MKKLSELVAHDKDFFVEDIVLDAIIFDESSDVTIWAKTEIDRTLCYFYLGLKFEQLSDILRNAGEAGEQLEEEISEKIIHETELPHVLEFNNELREPLKLEGLVLKIFGGL